MINNNKEREKEFEKNLSLISKLKEEKEKVREKIIKDKEEREKEERESDGHWKDVVNVLEEVSVRESVYV